MDKLHAILSRVRKPARYVGGEYGAILKDKAAVETRVAFCFPDNYEVGMSHLGMKLLYGLYNSRPEVWCERVFAPWPDMEAEMRKEGVPLYALESLDPLSEFDIIAFTLQYELCYTNVLNMLDLAGIPVKAADRHALPGIVIAGGPCTYNPEAMADFIDLFVIGEGEEVNLEIVDLYQQAKREGWEKTAFLRQAAQIPGVYVPALYTPEYDESGILLRTVPHDGAPAVVTKRIVQDFDKSYFPETVIVPNTEVIHDRVMLEVMRGCIRGCRFCQAGYTWRPVRPRSPETLAAQAKRLAAQTGYEEISLTSLSTSDHREIDRLCDMLSPWCRENHVSLALPSQRADSFSPELMEQLRQVRKTGLTFAPEAGSQRLRDVINKNILEKDILRASEIAFGAGANSVKLYFMIGLPTETDEDLLGIASMCRKINATWRVSTTNKPRGVKITASAAGFVPKPHTPFQWCAQATREELERKQDFLKEPMHQKNVTFHYHEASVTFLEGALARADRRVGRVIYNAWKSGCRFDAWDDFFNLEAWQTAFAEAGLDMGFYAHRERPFEECLPWDHISCGVRKEHLWNEYRRALAGVTTPDCREQCTGCGANCLLEKGRKCDA